MEQSGHKATLHRALHVAVNITPLVTFVYLHLLGEKMQYLYLGFTWKHLQFILCQLLPGVIVFSYLVCSVNKATKENKNRTFWITLCSVLRRVNFGDLDALAVRQPADFYTSQERKVFLLCSGDGLDCKLILFLASTQWCRRCQTTFKIPITVRAKG